MSKTIDLQIEKSRVLIEGLGKNIETLRDKGIASEELQAMAADLERLKLSNDECDKIREELSRKVKAMNDILTTVKEAFAEKKRIIKINYPLEQWIQYGVQDKSRSEYLCVTVVPQFASRLFHSYGTVVTQAVERS